MNIIFNSLEINDFQSIGNAKVELDNCGTVLVKGINEYEENTLSNGSGKSSIFEALYFSLYGKTTTGLTNVSNRYTNKTYKLNLKFSIDGIQYEINREGTRITLLQNGEDISRRNKTDTETYIKENILKLSPEIFLNIVYLAQGFKSRLSALTAGGRKDQIEELIGTSEITENFRIEMQNHKDKLNDELNETNNKMSYNNGTINQININKVNYQKEIDRINEENKNKIPKQQLLDNLQIFKNNLTTEEQKSNDITDKINKAKEFNSSIQVEILKIDNESNQLSLKSTEEVTKINTKIYEETMEVEKLDNEKILALNQSISNISNEISVLSTQKIGLENKIEDNKKQIETLKTSDTCPTCGRKFDNINQEHLINEIQKYINSNIDAQKQIQEIDTNNEIRNKEIEKLNSEIDNIKSEIFIHKQEAAAPYQAQIKEVSDKLAIDLQEKQVQKNELSKQLKSYENERQELNNISIKINELKTNITTLENEINNYNEESTKNYENLIEDCNKEIIKYNKENEELQKQINILEEKIGIASHCSSLISKEFKNYLLKSAVEFLNSKLEYYSNLLFSNDTDKIKFVQEGNKLDICLGDALFESLSGGEKRKVDIAIMLAQKDLANNMSNTYSNILILDEITDGLDSKSIDIVTSILMNVSKDISSMFVVSHKDTVIGHDSQIIVVKGKDRISHIM